MKLETLASHAVLPVADPVEFVVLVTLAPEPAGAQAHATPLDLRFALDRSGSMGEASGVGRRSKLAALQQAVAHAIDLLAPGRDQLSCVAFDDAMGKVLDTRVLASDLDKQKVKRDLGQLSPGGGTRLSQSLAHAIEVQSALPEALRRVVVFTDGHVNTGKTEPQKCAELAERARERGVALSVFAVGVDYNEAFLRDLASRAGLGSYYAHVSSVDEVRKSLEDEIAQLRASSETDLCVSLRPGAGASFVEVSRLVPQQVDIQPANDGSVTDALASLDPRGQRYLVRCRLTGGRAGVRTVLKVSASARLRGRVQTVSDEVHLELAADAARWSQPNGAVLATVVNAAGVRAATRGNVPLAKTLFTQAGNAAMVQQLTVLGSAAQAQPDGDAGRKLRTVVASEAHLPTLGSTPPSPRGQP